MRVQRTDTGAHVDLTRRNFILGGGEGDVYADGNFAIKVYKDSDSSIPVGKIAALAPLACDYILAPIAPVIHRSNPVGYVMKLAKRCLPLPRVLPKGWRASNGFDDAMRIVLQLRSLFERVHAGGALVIDPNDANFLMREDFSGVVAIDVDSYATGSYPASAIQPIVRDPSTKSFSKESDWYGFALLAFALLVGAHPFKGSMPGYGRKAEEIVRRMVDGASALRRGAKLPPTCFPVDVLPAPWRDWLEVVFHSAERPLPPATGAAPVKAWASSFKAAEVIFERLRDPGDRRYLAVGRTPEGKLLVVESVGRGEVFVFVPGRGAAAGSEIKANAVSVIDGRVNLMASGKLYEAHHHLALGRVVAKVVGGVSRHSTQLFPGVAIQYILGSCYASILSRPGRCAQVRLKEIEGARLVDAKFAGGAGKPGKTGVLRVAVDRGGQIEVHTWAGLRPGKFDAHWFEEVDTASVEVAELDTGVAAISTPDGAELFRVSHPDRRRPVKSARLATGVYSSDAGTLLVELPDGVYSAKLR